MAFSDKKLRCQDCGRDFVWTAQEQEFYKSKGFDNAPLRCSECRRVRKQNRLDSRRMYPIVCSRCGREDQVPFEPRGNRPVLCRECFQKR